MNSLGCPVKEYPPIDPLLGKSNTIIPKEFQNEKTKDKIYGTIFGNIIGDAIGFHCEFFSPSKCIQIYGKSPCFNYDTIIPERNFSLHPINGRTARWTDDSDQLLMILDNVLRNNGEVNELDFAKRMVWWYHFGLSELGDCACFDVGITTSKVLSCPSYLQSPIKTAQQVYQKSLKPSHSNGAVMRTAILGIVSFNNLEQVKKNSIKIASCTHGSPLSIVSALAISILIACLLQNKSIEESLRISEKESIKYLKKEGSSEMKQEFQLYFNAKSIDDLNLYENMGYALKTMGCGIYCLRNKLDYSEAIHKITMAGGDADTNSAVVGAVLGCYWGYSSVPTAWKEIPYKEWVKIRIQKLIALMRLDN